MNNNDTRIPSLAREGTQEVICHNPKQTKEMKIEKACEHQSERSCSMLQRVSCKSGKR